MSFDKRSTCLFMFVVNGFAIEGADVAEVREACLAETRVDGLQRLLWQLRGLDRASELVTENHEHLHHPMAHGKVPRRQRRRVEEAAWNIVNATPRPSLPLGPARGGPGLRWAPGPMG